MGFWFRKLGIPHAGIIDLYQLDDEEATWMCAWSVDGPR